MRKTFFWIVVAFLPFFIVATALDLSILTYFGLLGTVFWANIVGLAEGEWPGNER